MEKILSRGTSKISRYSVFCIAAAAVKLILMGLFSSGYQDGLFLPFVTDFVTRGGNVYDRFWQSGITNAFPYPPVMLLIQSVPGLVIRLLGVKSVFWTNFIFKLPSFFIDIAGLLVLSKKFPEMKNYIALFYYGSPVTLYSVYMHGQLDIIPTVFMLIAVCSLMSKGKKRYVIGIVFTSLAMLCKMHILAVLPVVVLYIMKRDGIDKAVSFIIFTAAAVIGGILPVMSEGFVRGVLLNAEQSVLTRVYFSFDYVKIYIPIIAVFIVYLSAVGLGFMNDSLFINLCSIVFSVFLALCPPMPGWYVWIVPYLAVFFSTVDRERLSNILIYVLMNGLYLVYFVFLQNRGIVDLSFMGTACTFLKINSPEAASLVFTLLSGTLLYLVFSMYRLGVAGNSLYKRKNIPFTIGIAGDSGAGKSTMTGIIEKALGEKNLRFIEGDGDHRWERGDEYWNNYTALNPKANYLYRQAEDLRRIRAGNSVKRVDYDHDTGRFTEKRRVSVKKYMILCGLHSMYLPQTRKNLDLKIYMDCDETLRRYWKIKRDTGSRGYSMEKILSQIEERMADAEKYIYPQKKYADLVIRYYDSTLTDCMDQEHEVTLSVKLTFSAAVDIEPAAAELAACGVKMTYDYSDDMQSQEVNISGEGLEGLKIPIDEIADRVIPQVEEITRERLAGENIPAEESVITLFLLLLISRKMQGAI